MSATTKRMLMDAVGNLIPQYYDPVSDAFISGTPLIDPATGAALATIGGGLPIAQKDANSQTIGGAFAPSDQGATLTGSASNQRQAIPAGTYYIRFDVNTADCNIKFGNGTETVTTTTGSRFQAGQPASVMAVPTISGVLATSFSYIGNTSSINWTPA